MVTAFFSNWPTFTTS